MIVPRDLIVLALIVRIAAQTFSGKAGDLGLLRTFVDFRRLSNQKQALLLCPRKSKDCNAMILKINLSREVPDCASCDAKGITTFSGDFCAGNKASDSFLTERTAAQ